MSTDSLVTIPGALLILQFCLMTILFVGVAILSRGFVASHGIRNQEARNPAPHYFWIIVFALLTIAPIFFSGKFSETWSPMLGHSFTPGFDIQTVKFFVFILDVMLPTLLIVRTGGWKSSPFGAVLFSIPAFAVLLRESGFRVGFYTLFIVIVYGVGLWFERNGKASYEKRDRLELDIALWVVGAGMLALTTVIGLLTRPVTVSP